MIQYSDLINPSRTSRQEIIFQEYHLYFKNYFVHFGSQHVLTHPLYDQIHFNWKIHLSIHPEEMKKAWLLIYPILLEDKSYFKVANQNAFTILKNHREKEQRRIEEEYQQFLSHYQVLTSADLRALYLQLYPLITPKKDNHSLMFFFHTCYIQLQCFLHLAVLNKQELFIEIQTLYRKLIDNKQRALTKSNRLINGMQYTLYIMPGEEQKHCDLLEKIEWCLLNAGIRPGIIFPTDRPIGVYSSIRHPGTHCYHEATDVENYNPDQVSDPFPCLSSLNIKNDNPQTKTMLQKNPVDQYKTLLICKNSLRIVPQTFFNVSVESNSPRIAPSPKWRSFI